MDQPQYFNFGSSEKLLQYFKEKSDDIEKVVILPPGSTLHYKGRPVAPPSTDFTMVVYLLGDQRLQITREDAELLLNDGILSRMKIKIEFLRGSC